MVQPMHKVSSKTLANNLKSMAIFVGIYPNCFSNQSGRATLITQMAFLGVLDKVGCLITGHHTTECYSTYDRSQELQQHAATLVAANPGLTYEAAMQEVSAKFKEEQYTGTSDNLRPLVDQAAKDKLMVVSAKKAPVLFTYCIFWFLFLLFCTYFLLFL
jgi:hypothetical protein